ncbi:dienelactone hydrolase family protein [Paraburkholderia sp. Ac-20340]|uniref:dienelactone hydrolase family protein n=1 Tax=Paraburkholderia sp. Ac-20340 TaxID=2703888 RepID=UPI00197D59AC|nr:dienelactone hydrolase family protein [Paraburkholderia sp. Ac-20340]MBN3855720.1 dienelactone hydrolase family protein [Paraburkholderia sp. Ac-20340]
MNGQWTTVKSRDGGEFRAYTALPPEGSGPGLVLLQEIFGVNANMRATAERYAEEGYVVMVPDLFWRLEPDVDLGYEGADMARALALHDRFDVDLALDDIAQTLGALRAHPSQRGKVGTLGFCLGGKLAYLAAARTDIDCAIGYYAVGLEAYLNEAETIRCPLMLHFGGEDKWCDAASRARIEAALADTAGVELYTYPGCDHAFASPARPQFDKAAAMMAYSRSLAMLRRVMGPIYDFNALWEEHCYHEFVARNPNDVMPTMVAQPYVNHIPTMTGGVGHDELKRFYTHHFVHSNPEDTRLIPISRTIGSDRVVDEFIFCCTHDREIDWLLPGLAPTGKYFEVPMLAVICFRGSKLYNEHIYWDQASVLAQIGAIDPTGLPIAGIESAKKLLDETLPSNTLMPAWKSSEGKPF